MENTLNQPSKLRTIIRFEINDDSLGTYNINSQIKFKISILKSNICDYKYAYIVVKKAISIANMAGERAAENDNNKKLIFKNCLLFTDGISEINNTQIDNGKDIDLIMQIHKK